MKLAVRISFDSGACDALTHSGELKVFGFDNERTQFLYHGGLKGRV